MRRIRFTAEPGPYSGADEQFEVDKEYELRDDQAQRWVDRQVAVYLDQPSTGPEARLHIDDTKISVVKAGPGQAVFPPDGPPGSQTQFVAPNSPFQPMPGTQQPAVDQSAEALPPHQPEPVANEQQAQAEHTPDPHDPNAPPREEAPAQPQPQPQPDEPAAPHQPDDQHPADQHQP